MYEIRHKIKEKVHKYPKLSILLKLNDSGSCFLKDK